MSDHYSPRCWHPTASIEILQYRAQLITLIRRFFSDRGVLEVDTPIVNQSPVSDPNIDLIQTQCGRYLQTSPEYAMKRLLAAGSGDIYQIAKVFRQGEAGRRHNPEFTMLEWYRLGYDHHRLANEVIELLECALGPIPNCRLTYQQAFLQSTGLDPLHADLLELKERGQDIAGQDLSLDRDGWLALLMSHRVETSFDPDVITVVTDFPASQAALSRLIMNSEGQTVAARFEVFYAGMELANGYFELTDAQEQQRRLQFEAAHTDHGQYDERLVSALKAGLPDCAGVALGVDRLMMLKTGCQEISEVVSFNWTRA